MWSRGKLRPEWEMDNFFCSHCCTSDVHFGQGRVGVTSTDASRYSLDLRFPLLNIVPSSLPFAKMLLLVLFHFGESILVPVSKSCTRDVLSNRSRNKTSLNPPANRSSMNSKQSRRLGDRESLIYQLMHHDGLYVKEKANPDGSFKCAVPSQRKNIAECTRAEPVSLSEFLAFGGLQTKPAPWYLSQL